MQNWIITNCQNHSHRLVYNLCIYPGSQVLDPRYCEICEANQLSKRHNHGSDSLTTPIADLQSIISNSKKNLEKVHSRLDDCVKEAKKTVDRGKADLDKMLSDVERHFDHLKQSVRVRSQIDPIIRKVENNEWRTLTCSQIRKLKDTVAKDGLYENTQQTLAEADKILEKFKKACGSLLNRKTQGQTKKYTKSKQQKLAELTKQIADSYFARGEYHRNECSNYQLAEVDYRECLNQDPKHCLACCCMGWIYDVIKKDKKKALEWCKRSSDSNPKDPVLLKNVAVLQIDLGQLKQAEQHLQKALALKHDLANAFHNLGRIKFRFGQFQEAVQLYSIAISSEPTADSYRHRAEAYQKLGNRQQAQRDRQSAQRQNR